jgi:hypothetical protein
MQRTGTAEKIPASGRLSSFDEQRREGVVTLDSMEGEAMLSLELLQRSGYAQKRVVIGSRVNCGLVRQEDGTLAIIKILEFRAPRQKGGSA